jgi:transposase
VQAAKASGLPPFARMAGTLQRWQEEVINYWHFPLTDALVEGKHNRLKVLKRRAYGYRNDRTFLLRILIWRESFRRPSRRLPPWRFA